MPKERAEEESEEGSTAAKEENGKGRVAATVRGVGEVPVPPGVRHTMDKWEGRASDKLRTAMQGMGVGEEVVDE